MRHQSSTGSGQTVEELFEQHSEKLFAYLRQHTPSREDAEDILVDTFMAALAEAKFAQLPPSGQVAWLWRVARNKVIDVYRRAKTRQSVNIDQMTEHLFEDEVFSPENAALRQEDYMDLYAHLQLLPASQKEILRMRFGQDLSCGEIAKKLGKQENAVRVALSRSLNLLRNIYRHEGGNQ